jgi:DNA modification methylase
MGAQTSGTGVESLIVFDTESNSQYLRYCKTMGVKPHPARFPVRLPEFFIEFLTEPGDLVLDIFAGSNTAGAVAESSNRGWIAFEKQRDYLVASAFCFLDNTSESETKAIYEQLRRKEASNVRLPQRMQAELPL